MLDEGVRVALAHLGVELRTVAYGEWEAPAASQLVALMEAGCLDEAPVWCGDLRHIDAAAFRGTVDAVVAGFPCQDLSVAGRRAGLNGKRSGLFFSVVDFADACGAWLLVLENVGGIASATASVVDEEEGELEERAAARVLGELADRGWNAEWITLSASDVGASHGRERWFCLAWRAMGNAASSGREEQSLITRAGRALECASSGANGRIVYGNPAEGVQGRGRTDATSASDLPKQLAVAHAARHGRDGSHGQAWSGRGVRQAGVCLADSCGEGREGCEQRRARAGNGGGQEAHGPASELRGALPLFAPGPADARWPGILARWTHLAPATEPGVRLLADGVALLVDESRNHQLRQVGNGVVPLCAAVAVVVLARRAGIFQRMKAFA